MFRRLPRTSVLCALLVGCSSSPSEEQPIAEDGGVDGVTGEVAIEDTSVADDTLVDDTFVDDTSVSEAEPDDTTTEDTTTDDTFVADTFVADSFAPDTFVADTFVDTFVADTFVPDTFMPDTFLPDTRPLDVGVDTGVVADCSTPPSGSTKWYTTLSLARFYASGSAGGIRSCFVEYRPAYELWSDGLVKRRWIYLPPGTKIETGPNPVTAGAPNMDRWIFPVGTRFFKEFARATDGKKLETRVWERTATGYRFGSFRWRADQSDADYTESGGPAAMLLDDNKTTHDIPTRTECIKCHDGEPGQGLGFSAVQLSKPPASSSDPTLLSIAARGWLSHVPSSWPNPTLGSPIPGTAVEAKGMGFLHANCGHCHNALGALASRDMVLLTPFGTTGVKTSIVYTTTVSVNSKWTKGLVTFLIDPGTTAIGDGAPTKSAVYMRPTFRGTSDQMPPLGTALVDTTGLASLEAFIKGL